MEWWVYWLAAAPVAAAMVMLTPLPGVSGRGQWVRAWVGLVAFLFLSTSFLTRCSVNTGALANLEQRLLGAGQAVAIYDEDAGRELVFAVDTPPALPSRDLSIIAQRASPSVRGKLGPGSASLGDYRPIRVGLDGTPAEQARLAVALARLAGTEYGSTALADVLRREDVLISFSNEIGVTLPTGQTVTTGGSAVTVGTHVYLSRRHYGESSTAVLAAMAAHELTHVAQNEVTGSTWWQWPWTTVNREKTAHLIQAIVWAELRGDERNRNQDVILEEALRHDGLQQYILGNPAYPWWLTPDLAC